MCHQSIALVQQALEVAGIATVSVTPPVAADGSTRMSEAYERVKPVVDRILMIKKTEDGEFL